MTADPTYPPRWRRPMAAVAVASLVAIGLVAAPAQAQVVECTGTLKNVVISGSVSVPDGEACQLINVMVVGGADVGSGADLLLETTVVGAVKAASSAFVFGAAGSVIADGVTLNQAFGLQVVDSIIFDGIWVNAVGTQSRPAPTDIAPPDPTLVFADHSNITGNVRSNNGWLAFQDGMVNGSVDTVGGRATDLFRMRISGATIDKATDGTVTCDTTSNGDFWVTGNGGFIQLGGPFPVRRCAGNNFVGDLQVHDNNAEAIQISGNLITQDVDCTGNTPAPVGHGNIILGTASGQCANLGTVLEGLIPPPGAPGDEVAVTEPERITKIAEPLAIRLAAARQRLGTGV